MPRYRHFSLPVGRSPGFASGRPDSWAPTACGRTVSGPLSPPSRGPFHLSLTVLSAIGLSGVFSLAGWCRLIRTGFLRPRPTQDPASASPGFGYGPLTLSGAPSQGLPLAGLTPTPRGPSYPAGASTPPVWAPPLSLATTGGITLVLLSCRYWDVSVRGVRPASTGGARPSAARVPPFGHPRISGHLRLPGAFRSLSRPSSPPRA